MSAPESATQRQEPKEGDWVRYYAPTQFWANLAALLRAQGHE